MFSTKEKLAFAALIVLLVTNLGLIAQGFYVAHTNEVPDLGGQYEEGLLGEPRYINPLLAQTQTDKDLTALVYSGLYKQDSDGNLIPDLAEGDIQISEDQKQYTVTLKENLRWQDGKSFSADDVIFTIATIKNADYQSPFRRIWQNIEVQKVDDRTLRFANKDISAPFIQNLTLGILPRHIWSQIGAANFMNSKFNLEPIGSGPYFVKEVRKTNNGEMRSMTLDSYSNYANGKPYIDRVVTRFYKSPEELVLALRTKDVDGISYSPFDTEPVLSRRNRLQTHIIPKNQYNALFFNLTALQKVLGERTVREAFAKSVDRDQLIREVYAGNAAKAYGPLLPGQLGYDQSVETKHVFDLNAANALLDQAGWIRDANTGIRSKNGQPLKFTITTNDFILNVKSAEELKNQWSRIGADISLAVVPTSELEKNVIQPRNFEALLFSESTGADPDPFAFWHSSQSKSPGFNIAQYNNDIVDRLITDARSTFNEDMRAQKYKEFQNIITTDLPAVFLTQNVLVYHLSPKIKGISINKLASPEDRFYNLPHWYIESKRVLK